MDRGVSFFNWQGYQISRSISLKEHGIRIIHAHTFIYLLYDLFMVIFLAEGVLLSTSVASYSVCWCTKKWIMHLVSMWNQTPKICTWTCICARETWVEIAKNLIMNLLAVQVMIVTRRMNRKWLDWIWS